MKKFTFRYLIALILLFLLQDIIALFFININRTELIYYLIPLKEVMIVLYLLIVILSGKSTVKHYFANKLEVFTFLLLCIVALLYIIVGLGSFPSIGVLFEGRAIFMPIVIYMLGSVSGYYLNNDKVLLKKLIHFIKIITFIYALSGIIDYFFIPVSFWESINAGLIDSAKGGVVASGSLPENFYSVFGRRALGLAINPLLLSYILIPGLVFYLSDKKYLKSIIIYTAMIVTFSRLPILAVFLGYSILKSKLYVKVLMLIGLIFTAIAYLDKIIFIFTDASAVGHYSTFNMGLDYVMKNPLGYGVGSAGVFAFAYSDMYAESSVLNLLNQIGVFGVALYIYILSFGFMNYKSKYNKDLQLMALIYLITAFLAPQIFVIKATFIFFIFLGINKKLDDNSGHTSPNEFETEAA